MNSLRNVCLNFRIPSRSIAATLSWTAPRRAPRYFKNIHTHTHSHRVNRVLVSHCLFDPCLHRDWTQERPSRRSRKWWQLTKRRKQQLHDWRIRPSLKLKEKRRANHKLSFHCISTLYDFHECVRCDGVDVSKYDCIREQKKKKKKGGMGTGCWKELIREICGVLQHLGPHFCFLSAQWKNKTLL